MVGLSGVGCITCQHCLLPQLSDLLYTETVIRHADLETAPLLVLANKQDRMVWLVGIQVHACTWITCFITWCPNILTQEVVVKYITHVLVKDFSLVVTCNHIAAKLAEDVQAAIIHDAGKVLLPKHHINTYM